MNPGDSRLVLSFSIRFSAAWIHDILRIHADIKACNPDREAQGAAAGTGGQGEGRRQAPRGSAAPASDARGEDRAQAGDRRKIVIGAIVRAAQTSRTDISLGWLEEQIRALKRPDDRALFDLDAEPSAAEDKAESAAPPITSRQKKLLAKLVEEHPRLAREFGVDPDEPGLEKLGKAKATSLIGAMLDRVKAQAPPDER